MEKTYISIIQEVASEKCIEKAHQIDFIEESNKKMIINMLEYLIQHKDEVQIFNEKSYLQSNAEGILEGLIS